MDGITILNVYMGYSRFNLWALISFILLGIFIFSFGFVKCMEKDNWLYGLLSSLGLSMIILSFIYIPTQKYIQATVDNSVSWIELTDKYEVIKVDGKILTMIEKEKKDDNN